MITELYITCEHSLLGLSQVIQRSLSGFSNIIYLYFFSEQPQEKQPFFLTEEERRTLVSEGLPVPAGLPLTKVYHMCISHSDVEEKTGSLL